MRRRSGELESEVLAALWAADRAMTPAQVQAELGGALAYTTVVTILSRLHEKGVTARERQGRAYAYSPVQDEPGIVAGRMRKLLDAEPDRRTVLTRFVTDLGEASGLKLFRDIVDANGISVRKGHSVLANLVATGEVPLALTVYGFLAEQAKRKGAPIDWFVVSPAIARLAVQGIARNAPHPNAAMLFYDFLISDGQQILASRAFVPASRKVQSPLSGSFALIDSAAMLDQSKKWQELYQKTFIVPSR